jgi:poly(A) polymerase
MLAALKAALERLGARGWLVGGTVRDSELGRLSADLDVVVSATGPGVTSTECSVRAAREVAGLVAAGLRRPWFTLSSEFGAFRVVGADGDLDLTALRGGSLEADLALRDFTVNAMAVPVCGGGLVDPFGGLRHLRERRLVAVSDHVFRDDPLRLMRASRLAHTLGLTIEDGLRRLIEAEAHLLPRAAAERVFSEVVLTLAAGRSSSAVESWGSLGVLPFFLPEVPRLQGVTQSDYHHLDVYGHTLETMNQVDGMIQDPGRLFPAARGALEERLAEPVDGAVSRPVALRLAALLHDIAKPDTRSVREDGRVCFMQHTQVGGPQSEEICRRLRTSEKVARLVRAVVEQHLTLGFLLHQQPLPERAVIEYLWQAAPWEPEVILVSTADRLATRGVSTPERYLHHHVDLAARLMERWRQRAVRGMAPCPLDGRRLQAELGLEPGVTLGRALRAVRLAWEAGEAQDDTELLAAGRAAL